MDEQDERTAPPEEHEEVETCRIALWRGYTTASFYACATGNFAGMWLGEPSETFRWRRRTGADTPEAHSAQRELVSRLKEEGWVTAGQGDEWYEMVLARAVAVPTNEIATVTRAREAPLLPTPELEPALSPLPPPASPPPPQPVLPMPAPLAGPAAAGAAPHSRRRVDRWRVVAAAGLVTAIGLLGWAATHPSSVGAAPGHAHPMPVRQSMPVQ